MIFPPKKKTSVRTQFEQKRILWGRRQDGKISSTIPYFQSLHEAIRSEHSKRRLKLMLDKDMQKYHHISSHIIKYHEISVFFRVLNTQIYTHPSLLVFPCCLNSIKFGQQSEMSCFQDPCRIVDHTILLDTDIRKLPDKCASHKSQDGDLGVNFVQTTSPLK